MQISRIRTILTSAYVTGMLVSAMPVVRHDAQLASAVNLDKMIAGLQTAGFTAASSQAQVIVPPAVTTDPGAQTEEPVITEELMARLVKRALSAQKDSLIDAAVCKPLTICDGTADIPAKQIAATENTVGKHIVAVPTKQGSKDIVVFLKRSDTLIDVYLTDRTGKLRAAAVNDTAGVRLVTNESVADKYRAQMKYLASLANQLPPPSTTVASNQAGS